MRDCGGRHFCRGCGEELIHRDRRRPWESASAFGQVIWRAGPVQLTTGDLDHYAAVFGLPDGELLRLIEHKQPDQVLKDMQAKVLLLMGAIMDHAVSCPLFATKLDARCGMYVVRGSIRPEADGSRRTFFDGPQFVSKASQAGFVDLGMLKTAEQVFRWLEGTSRRGSRRNQELPRVSQEAA